MEKFNKNCGNKKIAKKSGITFLILVITIAFILIITSTLTLSFFNIVDSTNKKEFASEIHSLQKLVEQYEFLNNKYPVIDNAFTVSLATFPMEERTQFSEELGYDENEIILKEIDLYEAGANEITRGIRRNDNELDVYAISETTGRVYYLKGEKIGDITYYTLTDELEDSLGL